MKVVINRCYGGFDLSREAIDMICERKGVDPGVWDECFEFYHNFDMFNDTDRADKDLVEVVEQLGPRASGKCADLRIVEIPDGVAYSIEEYDGNEWVAEQHRTWR